jgi:hypothetical protein
MVFIVPDDEGDLVIPYSSGTTFKLWGDTYTKKNNGGCSGNKPAGTPTNVKVTTNSSGVTATWNPVSGAKGYVIYRKSSSNSNYFYNYYATGVASIFVPWYEKNCGNDIDIAPGATAYFKVAAVNDCGVGGMSSEVSVTRPLE